MENMIIRDLKIKQLLLIEFQLEPRFSKFIAIKTDPFSNLINEHPSHKKFQWEVMGGGEKRGGAFQSIIMTVGSMDV